MKKEQTKNRFQNKVIYDFWIKHLWRYPNRLLALKTAISMGFLLIPFVIAKQPFIGVTLALGALAGALSETDDHPKGRIKALLLTLISFFISSISVELLRPYSILFGIGLVGSTITFIILGGLGERYRGITFGALLVAIYTMLGAEISPNWYLQPLLLPAGALCYGVVSLLLLIFRPERLLEEQLGQAFESLSVYMKEKAKLFPSDESVQEKLRNHLATLNIQLVNSIEACKNVLNSYNDAVSDQNQLRKYMHQFLLLQSLHERAASSHQPYDLLSKNEHNLELLEGLGQLMLQLSQAAHEMSKSLLMKTEYKHPSAIKWTVSALHNQSKKLKKQGIDNELSLLLQNLTQSHISMQNLNFNVDSGYLAKIDHNEKSTLKKLKAQFSFSHPRMRYAIRLSTCFIIGYFLSQYFQLEKGDWILLTSLFVCQPSYSETRKRLFQRILGTLSGVIAGVLIVQILPTIAGQCLLMLLSAYAFFVWLRKNYAISVVFVTTLVIAAFNLIAGKGIVVMGPRILDTLIGAFLAIVVVRFIWPDWQYKKLPQILLKATQENFNYFHAILKAYQSEKEEDITYRINRHKAHQADTALTQAWQGMKLEPKKHQKFQKHAFALTYLNHALLSYLSALGAHRNLKNYINEREQQMYQKVEFALEEAIIALQNNDTCSVNPEIKELLNILADQLSEIEKGVERQKLLLLYNIAEVTQQLLKESCNFQMALSKKN
jgi:uncharacterized membrane protein (TIGR01666 family)